MFYFGGHHTDLWSVTYTLTSEHFKNNIKIRISFKVHIFSNFFFQNRIGFTKKQYPRVILDPQEVICPSQIIFFSRNLLWAYASQIPRLCIVRHCIIDRNYSKNTDRVNIMNPKHLITLKWHDFQWPTIPPESVILMQAFKEFLLPFHTLLLTPSKQKLVN